MNTTNPTTIDFDSLTPADIHAMTYPAPHLDRYPHLAADLLNPGYFPTDAPQMVWIVMIRRNANPHCHTQVVPIKVLGGDFSPVQASSIGCGSSAPWVRDAVARRQRESGRRKWWQIFTPVRDTAPRIEFPRTHADTIEAMKDCQAWCDAQMVAYEDAQRAAGRKSLHISHIAAQR